MMRYVSLLRGINVGGRKPIRMETLRTIYEDLGFSQVRTYLQSGNVVFASLELDESELVKRIEGKIEQVYGYHVSVFIRQSQEMQKIISGNPFLPGTDPGKLHVTFLYAPPDEHDWSRLVPPANIEDRFARGESVIYLYLPNGYAHTRLPASYFEKNLALPVTDRNWNTVQALTKMVTET